MTGARKFLIAYNVNLLGTKEQAHRIALDIREQGRGKGQVWHTLHIPSSGGPEFAYWNVIGSYFMMQQHLPITVQLLKQRIYNKRILFLHFDFPFHA